MSQKKVEAYKEYKKNKDKIIKKEKRSRRVEYTLLSLVALALVAWLGFSVYNSVTRPDPDAAVEATEIDVEAYEDYLNDLETGFDR